MVPETPDATHVTALVRALERATDEVMDEWEGRPLEVPEPRLLRAELAAVAEAVRLAAENRSERQGGPPRAMDRGQLLRLLRAAVLSRWSDQRDGSLLLTMRAFQSAEEELSLDEPVGATEHPLPQFARTVLAEVSHMLRSPLGAIVMLADTLAGASDDLEPEAYRHRSRIIYRAALGLAALSEDLLTLTSAEDLVETATEFSLHEMVERVRDLVLPVCEARGTELLIRGTETERGHRLGPANTLARALLNLVLEAALRTREGPVEIEARCGEGDEVSLVVKEPGDGPSADEIFRVFRRDDDSDDYSMSADALRMVSARNLVRLVGGELEVREDEHGLRARFRVSLPHA